MKKATGGLLLQHIVPKKPDGTNQYGMIAGAPAPMNPAPAAPGALVTSDVAARAKAAAAALGAFSPHARGSAENKGGVWSG